MTPFDLVVLALATWRLSYMLVMEAGPFDVFKRLRASTKLGGLLECVFCMSVWVALGLYALWLDTQWPVIVLAVSGLGLGFDRYITG